MITQLCVVKPDVFMTTGIGDSVRDQLHQFGNRISELREILCPLPRNADNDNVYVDKNHIKFTLLLRTDAVHRPRRSYHLLFIFIICLFIYLFIYSFSSLCIYFLVVEESGHGLMVKHRNPISIKGLRKTM
jgi:hypothetical protein